MKMILKKAWMYAGVTYLAGERDVPEPAASSIKAKMDEEDRKLRAAQGIPEPVPELAQPQGQNEGNADEAVPFVGLDLSEKQLASLTASKLTNPDQILALTDDQWKAMGGFGVASVEKARAWAKAQSKG